MQTGSVMLIDRDGHEIAVVYFRMGYDPAHYSSEKVCSVSNQCNGFILT